ncbi:MAG: aspartate-semialdehyde dehydrogenase [Bacillota bacterium]
MGRVNVGIVGATGLVGDMTASILRERHFPVEDMRFFASARSAGRRLNFGDRELDITEVTPGCFEGLDVVFVCAGTDVSREVVPRVVSEGAVAIDKSNAYRMDPDVPLVVPEVNAVALGKHRGIIANPNCTTIQMVVALAPIARAAGLERVVASTYQSVSGTGREAVDELTDLSRRVLDDERVQPRVYPHQIAFNLLPHIDNFDAQGYSGEERKLMLETRKIMGLPELLISATTVRVPVYWGHGISVMVETSEKLTAARARELLAGQPGLVLQDDPKRCVYPMPITAAGTDEVYVGRIREDESHPRALHLWIVADNVRKGAATNAVQIAEHLFRA